MPRCDMYGSKRRKSDCWGRGDKASRERMRKDNRRNDREKHDRSNRKFERESLNVDHPQVCSICLDRVKTHLVVDCGNLQPPYHRYHGFCEECATQVVANGECPLCRGAVQSLWPVRTAFFVGH